MENKPNSEVTAKLKVMGMSCNHCSSRVENTVKGLDGAISANVNLAEKFVLVKFNPERLSIDKILSAINQLGFQASKN